MKQLSAKSLSEIPVPRATASDGQLLASESGSLKDILLGASSLTDILPGARSLTDILLGASSLTDILLGAVVRRCSHRGCCALSRAGRC